MVCNRCKWVVKEELEKLSVPITSLELGAVELGRPLTAEELKTLDSRLTSFGFELINDKNSLLIEQIKKELVMLAVDPEKLGQQKLSAWLSEHFHKDYSGLSKFFSEVEGVTIEQYLILQRIEKVKELLVYDEQSLTQMAYALGYSSVAHLSNQFKKITGMTPKAFRQLRDPQRKGIDEV